MNNIVLGILQGLGLALLETVLAFFADATHLNGLVNPQMALVVAAIALALENHLYDKTGKSLFGTVRA